MTRCDKGYPFCEDCINCGNQTGECDDCEDGDNFEPTDESEELGVHDLKNIRFFQPVKEAA